MSTTSLAEIVDSVCKLKTRKEKVEYLKKNNSRSLRDILHLMYDKNLEVLLPSATPPYTPSELPDSHGMLYRESRKLPYFVKGFGGERLQQYKRETLFIEMLETIDKEDAKLVLDAVQQKPQKGLTVAVINEALGDIIPTQNKKQKND